MEEIRHDPQDLLMRLSVFVGKFSLEAPETVSIDEQLTKKRFHQLLKQLAEASLITADKLSSMVRYSFSTQQTETALTSDCGHTHRWCYASNYIDLASHARQELFGLNRRAWFARLEVEQGTFEAALEWLSVNKDVQNGLHMAIGLREF